MTNNNAGITDGVSAHMERGESPAKDRRQHLREGIATMMHQVVESAPMTFVADPDVPKLLAELIIRAVEEAGWTPPAEQP